jgi:PAS domain-containing protein
MSTPANVDFGTAHDHDVAEQAGIYKTLLESTKAIPWKIDWASMQFAYIGPQIEQLLGWEQGSWLTVEDWVARIHPEDRDYVVNFCVSQSNAGVDHEADYARSPKTAAMCGSATWCTWFAIPTARSTA